MGSKHKHRNKEKEHKHKHRRRSRSYSKERHHKRNYDSSSEEESISKRKYSPSREHRRSRSHSEDKTKRRKYKDASDSDSDNNKRKKSPEIESKDAHTIDISTGSKSESLSIEETNKLREKLGLKPLDTGEKNDDTTDDLAPTKKEDVHVPAVNWSSEKRTKDLIEKLSQNKEKRKMTKMLKKVKTLGESDEDGDDIVNWVKKTTEKEASKLLVAKKEKEMDDMDEAFGLGDLIKEEFKKDNKNKMKDNIRRSVYSSKDLSGIKVEHDQSRFNEGTTTILTLKDAKILDEDNDDVLVNVNIMDNESVDKNIKNKSKKPQYTPYDDGQEFDEDGVYIGREVLNKYKDEIEGETMKSFKLDSRGSYNTQYEKQVKQMKADKIKQGQTLAIAMPILAQEYFTPSEMEKFKKPTKKRRKIRRKPRPLTADDLLDGAGDQIGTLGNRAGTTNIDEEFVPLD